jgi:tape measure domain-containing protein
MEIVEVSKLRLVIDSKEAVNGLAALDTKISELREKQKDYAKGTAEYRELNKEIKTLERNYQAVSERMDITKMTTQQLLKYQRELYAAGKKLVEGTDEFVAHQKKLNEVNDRVRHMNGLLRQTSKELEPQPTLWNRIKDSTMAFFAAFTLQRVVDWVVEMGRSAFTSVTELSRLQGAMRNVLGTDAEYQQSMKYLRQLSQDYGQDLIVLTKTYTNFIASSNSTNLSLKARQGIYESIVKAGGALRLSNEQIEGSLLAVSQMFSKGNVSAEELRGQLGERLPGAFGIMAEALGVSEKQLNKMLEQGEVLAEEALPKFAAALEATYGAKAQNNLEEIGGANSRLTSKILSQVAAWNDQYGATRRAAGAIVWITDNLGLLLRLLGTVAAAVGIYNVAIRASAVAMALKSGALTVNSFLSGQAMLARVALTGSTNAFTMAELRAAAGARTFNAALAANPIGLVVMLIAALVAGYQIYSSEVEKAEEKQRELSNRIADGIAPLKQQQAEFNRLAEIVLDGNGKLEDRERALDKLQAKYPEQLRGIDNLKDAESKLGAVIRNTNADFVTRARLMEAEIKMSYNNELATKAIKEKILLEQQLKNASTNRTTLVTGTAGYTHTFDSEAEKIQKLIKKKDELVLKTQEANAKMADSSEALMKKLNYNYDEQGKKETELTGKQKKELDKREKAQKKALVEQEKALLKQAETTVKILKEMDEAWIASETDEVKRKKKTLMAKYEAELEAFEKLGATREQYAELEKQLKEKLVRDLEEIGQKVSEKERKAMAKKFDLVEKEFETVIKWAKKEHDKREELTGETLKSFEKVQKRRPELTNEAALKVVGIEKRLGAQIIAFHKEVEKNRDAAFKKEQEQQVLKEQLMQQGFNVVALVLNEIEGNIDKQLALATTATEKAVLLNKKAWLSVADSAMGALSQLAQGNVVGAIVGGLGALFGALNNWVNKSANLMEARLEDLRQELEAAGKQFLEFANGFTDGIDPAKIEAAYEGLYKISTIQPVRLDFGAYDTYERRIKQEIDIATAINRNYDTAVQREDDYSKQVISNIGIAHNEEINRIRAKYDLLDQLANQQLGTDTLAVRELQGQQLLDLIANEAEKTAILTEYATKRNEIITAFALADKVITEETDQATIDAINAARDARNTALVELQGKLNEELVYMAENEDGKRKELTATGKIAKEAEESLATLRLEKQAAAIEREAAKNTELVAAEQTKNNLLEAEATRHNDVLAELGRAKDAALAESFSVLKDLINNGYDEMMQKALDAFNAGKLTAEQYNEIASKLYQIQGQINGIDWSKVTIPNFDWNFNLPRFAGGTDYVDKDDVFPDGVDTVPAMLDKGERVLSSADNFALGNMTNDELMARVMSTFSSSTAGLADRIANSSIALSGQLPSFGAENISSTKVQEVISNQSFTADNSDMVRVLERIWVRLGMLENIDATIQKKPILSTKMLDDHQRAVDENNRRGRFR